MNIATGFDPILMGSVILMQIGARYLDIELTDFQKKILKHKIVQTIILFGLIYMPVRDIGKTIIIIVIIYLIVYVIFNETNNYNLFSKKYLYEEGIIKNYNNIKQKYYNNILNFI